MSRQSSVRQWQSAVTALVLGMTVAAISCRPGSASRSALQFVLDTSRRTSIDTTHTFAMTSAGVTQSGKCERMRVDSSHHLADSLVSFLERNGYCTWVIPEYHDEQRLSINGGTAFGPVAHSFASPWTLNYTSPTNFENNWVNVAIIAIDTTLGASLPAEYRRLHLVAGYNCVFVNYDPSASPPWSAAMIPNPNNTCGQTLPNAPPTTISDVVPETPSANADDYPAVSRFIEGKAGATHVGVRCGSAWCVIGAKQEADVPDPTHKDKPGSGVSAQWTIKGWFDDQHLAVVGSAGALVPGPAASIVPDEGLAKLTLADFESDWQLVAKVYIPAPDKNTKYGKAPVGQSVQGYGLSRGINPVWMRVYNAGTTHEAWRAQFSLMKPTSNAHSHTVDRKDHSNAGLPVPATARWRWFEKDEVMWVACMIGCCTIEPDDVMM